MKFLKNPESILTDSIKLMCVHFLNFIATIFTLKALIFFLGTSEFGKLVVLQTLINYSVWLVQWSAPFDGTPAVAKIRDNNEGQMQIFSKVMCGNLLISLACSVILFIIFIVYSIEVNYMSITGGILFIIATAMSPVWFLHGQNKIILSAAYQLFVKLIILFIIFNYLKHYQGYHFYIFVVGVINFLSVLMLNIVILRRSESDFRLPYWKEIVLYIQAGSKSCISSTAINTQTVLSPIFLNELSSLQQVGAFGIVERIRGLCVQISHPVMYTLFPKISYMFEKERAKFDKTFSVIRGFIILFYAFICVILACLSGFVLEFFGSQELAQFKLELQIMCIVIFITMINEYYLYQRLYATNLNNIALKSKVIGLFVFVIFSLFLVQSLGALGAIISLLCAELSAFLLVLLLLHKHEQIRK